MSEISDKTEHLFVYAELKGLETGRSIEARGELRRRLTPDGDGAAQFKPDTRGLVHGKVAEVTEAQLARLDKTEAPEFKRRRIKLTDGTFAWAYQYEEPDFKKLPIIPSGVWRKPGETSNK